ncbi:MAG: 4-hydroxyphenylacetate 3-hydroxylase N-terminal domain-containing protein [Panacagrimonas sp.]
MNPQTQDRQQQKNPANTPLTASEYLEGLKDGREVWIHGERVKDVTTHPAFRNSARSVARLYEALHDPAQRSVLTTPTDTGNGGFTHPFYKAPQTREDLVASRDAIAAWQRLGFGYMGRSPDYKASFLATLGANAEFYAPYQENARRWYKFAQERVLYVNHAIVHPPIDKHRPADEVSDVCVHVEKETDAGIVVSGAKVVATASALTHYNFVGHYGLPMSKPEFAVTFMVPMNSPGLKLICRQSYEMVAAHCGSPFDYPLSSRLDENDSILVLDKVLVPWENLFIYRDVQRVNDFAVGSGFLSRALFHGCTRLAVKLDFLSGLFLKAVEMVGTQDMRNIQVAVGEVMAWRNFFWAAVNGSIQDAKPWIGGTVLPGIGPMHAYRVFSTSAYGRIKELMEQTLGSSLIYLCSNVADLKSPELRPYIDRYVRGANGRSAADRIKLMKLVWDSLASEFAGRHELYERNYSGNWEDARVQALQGAIASGEADACKALVDQCMSEYDLDGWRLPGFINPDDVNVISRRQVR